jgi:hypothetical protein
MAATAEQVLLAEPGSSAGGSARCWAAVPLIAHNTEFRRQQVLRLRAIRCGQAVCRAGGAAGRRRGA